jgi:uncharacterized protein (UPF0332 family)
MPAVNSPSPLEQDLRYEIVLYMQHARQMLDVAAHNLTHGFYGSAVNRSYYAIFYAANALLRTKGIIRSKHSGVIAAFRQHFVKPELIEVQFSRAYGRVMDDRHVSDYDVETSTEQERAQTDLEDARRFVGWVEQHLTEGGWL